MSFAITFPLILKKEGVYDFDPDDAGQETVFGITRTYEPTWKGWLIVDGMFPQGDRRSNATLKAWAEVNLPQNPALTAEVQAYYLSVFDKLRLEDEFTTDALDSCIMGGYVNQGPRVIRWLQEAILELGVYLDVDGQLGPATSAAIEMVMKNPMGEQALLHGLMIRRVRAYSKSKPKYVVGLLNRLFDGA